MKLGKLKAWWATLLGSAKWRQAKPKAKSDKPRRKSWYTVNSIEVKQMVRQFNQKHALNK